MTADDILLEAFEMIDTTADSGFAEHLGCLLEGSCGNEAVGTECGAGNALEHQTCCCRTCLAGIYGLQTLACKRLVFRVQFARTDNLTLLELL